MPAVTHDVVDEVVAALDAGGVVVLPTDTVYGLVARAADPRATAQLSDLKGRAAATPIAVLCTSVTQALALVAPHALASIRAVGERWWPGPLTIVSPRAAGVRFVLGGDEATIGLRVPDHELVRAVAARVGPLAATSANPHGEPTPLTAPEVAEVFGERVALVVDGGPSATAASTVVDATGWPWRTLREGPIATSDILDIASATRGAG